MRRNARSWVVRVALGVIALVFIFFMGGGAQLTGGPQAVATVGDEEISLDEFERTRRRNEAFYREQYGDRLTPELLEALDLPSLTLNQLVDSAVLRAEAERLGLRVPDDAVRAEIREIEAFQRNGMFSPATYRAILQSRGMSPAAFEESLRREMLAEQLVDLIRRGVHLTDDDAYREWARAAEQLTLEYVRIPSKRFEDEVVVDEKKLEQYYEEHAEEYREPVKVRFRYLAYRPNELADATAVRQEEIEEYYVLNEDELRKEETVSARHILKRVDAGADEEAKKRARDAIERVKARLDAGENFAEVAKEESEDPGSAKNGGDLGAFGRGRMVKPFEDAAFALEPGETSDIVETPFGYHLIQVYDRQEGGLPPLEEVRDEIAEKLASEDAEARAFDLSAADALELREDRTTLEALAELRGLEIHETGLVTEGGAVEGIAAATPLIRRVIALSQPGDVTEPVKIGDTYYVAELVERQESKIPDLTEVRDRVERAYRRSQARELARQKANAIIDELRSGKTLAKLAEAEGWKVEETEPFDRRGAFVPGVGNVAGLKEVAFKTKQDGEVLPRPFIHRDDVYVFVRKARIEPERDEFEENKEQILEALRSRKEEEAVRAFVESLKQRTEIAFNRALLDRYFQ